MVGKYTQSDFSSSTFSWFQHQVKILHNPVKNLKALAPLGNSCLNHPRFKNVVSQTLSLIISQGSGNKEQKHNFTGSQSLIGSSYLPFYVYTNIPWGGIFCFMSIIRIYGKYMQIQLLTWVMISYTLNLTEGSMYSNIFKLCILKEKDFILGIILWKTLCFFFYQ